MAAKIFITYRRDDDPSAAARVRDSLAQRFGDADLFIDVDNLVAGQRFDEELTKALTACDVLIAIIGPRWIKLLKAKNASGERDYVREEIAGALQRKIIVVPVRVGREGHLSPLPRAGDLPEDIRDLVLYQKHDVTHEHFGRDITELSEAIESVRRSKRPQLAAPRLDWRWIGATAIGVLAIGYVAAHSVGVPVPWPWSPAGPNQEDELRRKTDQAAQVGVEKLVRAARANLDTEWRPEKSRPAVWQTGITAVQFGGAYDYEVSAYDGHVIGEDEVGVALPYRLQGNRPKVRVFKDGRSVVCDIVDVGPWSDNDPYWQTGTRPRAESGKDLKGRMTDPAGIALTPLVFRLLGISQGTHVDWGFEEPQGQP